MSSVKAKVKPNAYEEGYNRRNYINLSFAITNAVGDNITRGIGHTVPCS